MLQPPAPIALTESQTEQFKTEMMALAELLTSVTSDDPVMGFIVEKMVTHAIETPGETMARIVQAAHLLSDAITRIKEA